MEYIGKVLTVEVDGGDLAGVCTSTRTVSGGDQVFLDIPERPGRYFFVSELKAPAAKPKKKVVKTWRR